MKTNTAQSKFKSISFTILLFISVCFFSSCARKISFLISSFEPAARGVVKVSRDKNKNYVVDINIYNLAEVKRLQPSKNTYVVWMITDQNEIRNLGQIKSSEKMMSTKLKASFESASSYKPVKIFISAEEDGSTLNPGTMVVLTTDNF